MKARGSSHGMFRHGQCSSPTYHVWMHMKARCDRASHPKYHRYGGRGIRYCERWADFRNFLVDMGEQPPGLTLDHIDNDGHYEPGNCRWATTKVQARNKATTVTLTHNGVTKCIADWAAEYGLNRSTLRNRLRMGWDPSVALSKTPRVWE